MPSNATRSIYPFSLFVLVLIFFSACSGAPKKPDKIPLGDYRYAIEYLTWMAEKEIDDNAIPGLSIALIDDQRLIWSKGFGYADVEKELLVSADTLFRVGSISKVFTATAVMQLIEQGKMKLHEPITTYLPAFSIHSRFDSDTAITPHNIMTHHSGLPSDYVKAAWSTHPLTAGQLLPRLQKEYLATAPGTVLAYSNLGYTLLGYALANATHNDFQQHMRSALLQPTGMQRSSFESFAPNIDNIAKAYRKSRQQTILGTSNVPAGGLWSSANDMAMFAKMIFNDGASTNSRLLEQASLRMMFRPQNEHNKLDFDARIGLGRFLNEPS